MMHDEEADRPHQGGLPPLVQNTVPGRKLGNQAHQRIGTHLRAMYDSVVQQPIPSRFTDLIAKLDDTPSGSTTDEV